MVVSTLERCWQILRDYFENNVNVAECVRKLRTDFGRREKSKKKKLREKPKTVRTPESIAAGAESVRLALILILAGK